MKSTSFDDVNTHALDFYLVQGFGVFWQQISQDVKAGKFVLDGVHELDKQELETALGFITDVIMKQTLNEDKKKDVAVSNAEKFRNKSSIQIIERVLNSQHPPSENEFPKLNTVELIDSLKHSCSYALAETSKRTRSKIFELLSRVIEENPDFQRSGEGISKDLLLYALHHLKDINDRMGQGIERLTEVVFRVFRKYNESDVPYQAFVQAFRSKFVSVLNMLASGLEEAIERTQNLVNELREKGNNLMAFQSYAQAIKVYTEALLLASPFAYADVPQIYTNRAIAFIGLNCVPEAIDDLNTAIFLDRAFTPAWTQLGYCHMYMGNGLLALECYDTALKTYVGEVLPNNFPIKESVMADEYRDLRLKTVLPQFVQRLSSAIALTEKRAYQQNAPDDKIKAVISDVRKLLARLRAVGPEDDRDCFTYTPLFRDSSLRDLSQRFNESHPNILTPEATQNILARNGMETATITQVEAPPHANFNRNPRAGDNNRGGSPDVGVFGPVNSEAWPLSSLRDMIGDFTEGDASGPGGRQGSRQPPRAEGGPGGDTGGAPNNTTTNNIRGTNGNTNPRPNEQPGFANILPDALRNVLSPGILSSFERFTQGNGNAAVFVNGVEVSNRNNSGSDGDNQPNHFNTQQPAGAQRQNASSSDTRNVNNTEPGSGSQESSSDQQFESELQEEELD
ncbi:hypothetical protein KGF57_001414 [Candida theae]|uniref:Uncharacterized protein n=1 Tax=Candida theae TaxID=1198502 RepID=A0AAD5BH01_9ASCO|nr:uncharacterized protein KGF57_001414 [Candida theae]KAI5962762.1 hypothetical protein KGF57_001414 [Candida theae]